MARPAPDMTGDSPKSKIRATVPQPVRQVARSMRSERPDDVVNEAQAIRMLLEIGLSRIESGHAPTASEVKSLLEPGGHKKDLTILKRDEARLKSYYRANIDHVDGIAGAARHALTVAVSFLLHDSHAASGEISEAASSSRTRESNTSSVRVAAGQTRAKGA